MKSGCPKRQLIRASHKLKSGWPDLHVAASPVGKALEDAEEKLYKFIENKYKAVGRNDVQSVQASAGALSLVSVGILAL